MSEEFTCKRAGESDLESIAELFRRSNYGPGRVEWLRWKYLGNPDGAASTHIVVDPHGSAVAVKARLSRRFSSMRTGTFLVTQPIDIFVEEKHRGKGIHRKLNEFTDAERLEYPAISFPNKLAKSITPTRQGEKRVYLPLEEWRFPVAFGQLIRGKPLGFLAPLVNALSRLYAILWLGRRPKRLRITPVSRFDRDYEPDPNLIHGIRSAEYLNWRFIDNPMHTFLAHEFFDDDESIGYCVYTRTGASAEIFDLIIYRRWRACLKLLVDTCRREGISHVSFRSVGYRLGRFGFIKLRPQSSFSMRDTPDGDWLVTLADSDY